MRSPRDFSAVEDFRENWVKCLQALGMMRDDEFDGVVALVSEDLILYREYRQNQALNHQTIPLPLDNALDEVKFELGQISAGQMGISNFIDSNLLDNVGNLLEEQLLNNADTRSTLTENLSPAEPFEPNFQGTFEGQQHSLGVDYRGFQNLEGADERFTQMMAAEPSQMLDLDSVENFSPIISVPVNLSSVTTTSQMTLTPKLDVREGKPEDEAKVFVEATNSKGSKKVEVSGSPVTTCGQARRERNLKAFENKSSLAAERRAKEVERRSKEMARRQVAIFSSVFLSLCLCAFVFVSLSVFVFVLV